MSFIVSYKGQFSPYKLPDLSHYDKLNKASKAAKNKRLEDHEDDDFENILGAQKGKDQKESNKLKKGLGAYHNVDKYHQKHKIPYLARDLMSAPVDCLLDTDTLGTVIDHMTKFKYRHFPIVDRENNLVGIISDRDVIKMLGKPNATPIKDFMTSEVLTALDFTRIQDIAKIMLHEKFNCLPVINEKHVIVGIITQTNILSYVTKTFPIDV